MPITLQKNIAEKEIKPDLFRQTKLHVLYQISKARVF